MHAAKFSDSNFAEVSLRRSAKLQISQQARGNLCESRFIFHSTGLYLQDGYIVSRQFTKRGDHVSKREELVAHRLFVVHPLGSPQLLEPSG